MKTIAKMMPMIIACFMIVFGCAASNAQSPLKNEKSSGICGPTDLEEKVKKSVVLLFGQMDDSSLRFFCTGTLFEHNKKSNKYRIITAAHCVSDDDLVRNKAIALPIRWFVTFSNLDDYDYYPVELIGAGFQSNGDDLAVLELESDKDLPIIPFATDDPVVSEDFINVASPLGLGKQKFDGQISKERIELPIASGTINWRNNALVQTSSGPGSSGSSIVSRCKEKIIAILVGAITYPNRGTPNVVVVPASRFNKFYSDLKSGSYKHFEKDQTSMNSFWANQSDKRRIYKLRDRAYNGVIYDMETKTEMIYSSKE